MRKAMKRVLLIGAIIIVILLGASGSYVFTLLSMTPVKTGQILNTNIYAVNDTFSAIYFINTNAGYIVIDAGTNAKKVEASIKEAGINTNDVKWLLLTHSDSDHVAALTLFPNAKIYMSKDELPLLNGTMKRHPLGGNSLPGGIDFNKVSLLSNDEELFFSGIRIKCIEAPGHTIGSMLYFIDDKYLFTGDAFKVKNGKKNVHPFTMDAKQAEKTIERVNEAITGSYTILTGHYGVH